VERGAGVPILSSVNDDRRAHARSISIGKIGGTAHPWAGPVRHGMMENPAIRISWLDREAPVRDEAPGLSDRKKSPAAVTHGGAIVVTGHAVPTGSCGWRRLRPAARV
jgi:hypothetical protein